MSEQYSRTALLLGEEKLHRLAACRVAIFGLGGVGGGALEALARSGIGTLDLIDDDKICPSNLNRQLISLHSTLGQYKAEAAAARVHDIDPTIKINIHKTFYLPQTADSFDFTQYDYIVDAIDTVTAKLHMICEAEKAGVPIISVMGCGNRLDPTKLVVTDIFQTSVDPLARVMRRELKKRGVKALKVVYSTEPPLTPLHEAKKSLFKTPEEETQELATGIFEEACPVAGEMPKGRDGAPTRRSTPGSVAFVPPVAGFIAASVVVRELLAKA